MKSPNDPVLWGTMATCVRWTPISISLVLCPPSLWTQVSMAIFAFLIQIQYKNFITWTTLHESPIGVCKVAQKISSGILSTNMVRACAAYRTVLKRRCADECKWCSQVDSCSWLGCSFTELSQECNSHLQIFKIWVASYGFTVRMKMFSNLRTKYEIVTGMVRFRYRELLVWA
jgi:hypothetical protein